MNNKNRFEGTRIDNGEKVVGCYVFGLEAGEERHCIVNQTEEQKKTGAFTSYPVIKESVEDIHNMREFILQQLLGYRLGKEGFPIKELVSSANLKREEWISIQDETDVTSLSDSDLNEIEQYVNKIL